jgi:ribonuclease Z
MKITFLGTGAADSLKYYNTCFFIHDAGEKGMLVDTGGGNGILVQLKQAGIPLESIDRVLITHPHIDHLLGIFWILRFLGPKIINGTTTPLTVYAPQRTKQIIEQFAPLLLKEKVIKLFGEKIFIKQVTGTEIITAAAGEMTIFDARGEKSEMYGFRYNLASGKSLVMIGDEPYKAELEQYCKGVDLFIHESYCLESDRAQFKPETMNHSTVKEAAETAAKLGVKSLLLTHTEERATLGKRKVLYTEEASKFFTGDIVIPEDLEKIEI